MPNLAKAGAYRGELALRSMLDLANKEGGSRLVEMVGALLVMPVERKFASLETIQLYCDKVLAAYYPKARPVKVRERKGEKLAHYQAGTIAIPVKGSGWALREIVVLHELAHHVTAGHRHDAVWQEAFLNLLDKCMAPEAAFAMRILWENEK